jgi:hypothetical protein
MNLHEQIDAYISSIDELKRKDIIELHKQILATIPDCTLWFLDGKDENGKVVSNPNIGYGNQTIKYANGKTRQFYQVGISANTKGISVYILGLDDKNYLQQTFGQALGKASVTGYCIKFKTLNDIEMDVLMQAIGSGIR